MNYGIKPVFSIAWGVDQKGISSSVIAQRVKKVARAGGEVANKAKKELESKTGKKVITSKNAKNLHNNIEEKKD